MTTLKLIIKACAVIAYAFLLIMHFILKDYFQILQVFFYAFPLPFIILLGTVVTLLLITKRIYFLAALSVTLGLSIFWLSTAYKRPGETNIPKDATKVVFWNAADGWPLPTHVLIEQIESVQPDIIGLVETQYASEDDIEILSTIFPNYEFRILYGTMLVGVKGTIIDVDYHAEAGSYRVNLINVQLKNRAIALALTDIFQSPTMDKKMALETVLKYASQSGTHLIMGDFNTPQESVHFRKFQKNYTSFHDYGNGFTATWPFGYPLLELDQIFTIKTLTPLLLEKTYHAESDHAMLTAYFN